MITDREVHSFLLSIVKPLHSIREILESEGALSFFWEPCITLSSCTRWKVILLPFFGATSYRITSRLVS